MKEFNVKELENINGGGWGDAMAGAGSLGVGVGIGVAGETVTTAFLLSNPIGWGILGSAAVAGAGFYLMTKK